MSKLFGIHLGSDFFTVVQAENEDSALTKLAYWLKDNDEEILDDLNMFSVNMSFMERFFHDSKGDFYNDFGELREDINSLSDEEAGSYINNTLESNIREYWKEAPYLADEYINEYKKFNKYMEELDENASIYYTPEFSDRFYVGAIRQIILEKNYYEDYGVVEIDTKEKDVKVIYQS
ncbi:hypothetical protein [Bacillus weihaiensis]|uniref:hypothetical protein n=1 Tax=Bacillus weihaiensis TaxID=1547283 RepID=UPI002355AA69|nr:hypothetical protein [Bacillus weihaiensis]